MCLIQFPMQLSPLRYARIVGPNATLPSHSDIQLNQRHACGRDSIVVWQCQDGERTKFLWFRQFPRTTPQRFSNPSSMRMTDNSAIMRLCSLRWSRNCRIFSNHCPDTAPGRGRAQRIIMNMRGSVRKTNESIHWQVRPLITYGQRGNSMDVSPISAQRIKQIFPKYAHSELHF